MSILVIGGAGYIGSHMVKQLSNSGTEVITLDNLSCGYRDAVKYGEFVEGDLGDPAVLDHIFSNYSIDAVMHFAAFIEVGESVRDPARYYKTCQRDSYCRAAPATGKNIAQMEHAAQCPTPRWQARIGSLEPIPKPVL